MTRVAGALFLLLFTVACGDRGSVGPPTTGPSPAPTPTPVGSVVSGVVLERTSQGARPVPGATVSLLFPVRQTATDAAGRYRFAGVPDGFFVLQAWKGIGFDQPCGATVHLTADATIDIELVPQDSPSLSMALGSPILSGVVFETTSEGRRPVPGARIFLGGDIDPVIATTTSNADGRYLLCRLPVGVSTYVDAAKSGYASTNLPLQIQGDAVVDIEMIKRE